MKSKSERIAKVMVAFLLVSAVASHAAVRYVASDGSGGNGQSWATAYRSIKDAVDDPALGSGDEIRVKQGTYVIVYPIKITKAVKVYGGFSGVGSTRDSQTYLTTIDAGDDTGCVHVTANAHIDGFTIANGHAWGMIHSGGGINIANCGPTIANCVFYRNHAAGAGGGIAAENATGAMITDCVFIENTANWNGGGIFTRNSNLTVTNCTFEANESNRAIDGLGGGGIFNVEGAPTISNCVFTGNAAYYGAGICNYNADARVEQCVFADCNSVTNGGGGLINYGGSPRISDCVFSGNRVGQIGAGVLDKSTATFVNCIIWDNSTSRYGGGIYVDSSDEDAVSAPRFTNCILYGNDATRGGGLYSNNVSATLTNCIVWENGAFISGPGIYNDIMQFNAKTIATYCNIQGDSPYAGTGNVLVEPGFIDPEYGDFHLPFGSPCIDAGYNAAPGLGGYDFEGKPRIADGDENGTVVIDMGVFEFPGRTVSDYLQRAQMAQGRVYESPDDTMPAYTFVVEFQTGPSVSFIDFLTPAGHTYTIPSNPQTSSAFVDTYHQVSGKVHIWTYMAEFATAAPLADYGDGTYLVTVYYTDGTDYETALWYGVPGTGQALPQPKQKPNVTHPSYGGDTASPVTFTWSTYPDPINSICLAIMDPSTGDDLVNECLSGSATSSSAHTLAKGAYNAELAFENSYEVTNADGVPFAYGKGILMGYKFEVLYDAVYRFWSPVSDKYFYTISESEKDWLIANYPDYWTYDGPAFYAYPEGKQPPECKPIYRFWNIEEGGHFYTIDESEKDNLIAQSADTFVFEGIAFYAYS